MSDYLRALKALGWLNLNTDYRANNVSGDPDCPTVWKECLHGLVSIIPTMKYMNSFTVKGQGGRDKVQVIPVGTLMQAVQAAEDLSHEYGGWI